MMIPLDCREYLKNVLPTMNGWCTYDKAMDLIQDVINRKPVECAEIGVFAGRSLFAIALALKANKNGRIVGIDPWLPTESTKGFSKNDENSVWWNQLDHDSIFNECHRTVENLDLSDKIELFRGTSEEAAKKFQEEGRVFDMIHIDGNHSEECSVNDVNLWLPLLRESGTVWFDDIDWQTTHEAQRILEDRCTCIILKQTYAMYQKKNG